MLAPGLRRNRQEPEAVKAISCQQGRDQHWSPNWLPGVESPMATIPAVLRGDMQEAWLPEVICSHLGWGLGLFHLDIAGKGALKGQRS